jgi:hypothetical protein
MNIVTAGSIGREKESGGGGDDDDDTYIWYTVLDGGRAGWRGKEFAKSEKIVLDAQKRKIFPRFVSASMFRKNYI